VETGGGELPKSLASLSKDFKESTRMAAKDAVAVVGAMGAEEFHHIIANRWF
jgi:hypothetical protein